MQVRIKYTQLELCRADTLCVLHVHPAIVCVPEEVGHAS